MKHYISGKENYRKIVAEYKFYLPDFALSEIQKYQSLILEKKKPKEEELKDYTLRLFSEVVVVPNFLISNRSFLKAFQLCIRYRRKRHAIPRPFYRI